MKVLPLVGVKSLAALNAFNLLLVGLSMVPGMGGLEFMEKVGELPEADREKLIRKALLIVTLQKEEVEALASFATDKNGVPYGPENLKNLSAGELHEILSLVCMEIGKIRVSLVTSAEKKSSDTSQ